MVNVWIGCEASECSSNAKRAYAVVWFEFGCYGGNADGVEGIRWELSVCNSVYEYG